MAPPRLHRILFDVLLYSPNIVYKKGSTIPIPDTLSRDCIPTSNVDQEPDELEIEIIITIPKLMTKQIREETATDDHLQKIIEYINTGWPKNDNQISPELKPYSHFKEELSFYDGLIFKGNRIVVPKTKQKYILDVLHQGHPGIQNSLRRARECIYWKNLTSDVIKYIRKCTVCEQTARKNQKEPIIIKEIPEHPFQIVASDLFTFNGKNYLLLVDSFSGWYDFKKLKQTTSTEVILHLKNWFALFGIPTIMETDNGPQYTSSEFSKFVAMWQIEHKTSSPGYPQSNGLAERYVQTAKLLLKRCSKDINSDVYLGLLDQKSPNERLMNKKLKLYYQ